MSGYRFGLTAPGTAAASLASLARFDAEGLDWSAGMDQDEVDDTRLFLTDEAAARKKLDKDREEILAASPDELAEGMESADRFSSGPASFASSCGPA
jgi:hypothetical protein